MPTHNLSKGRAASASSAPASPAPCQISGSPAPDPLPAVASVEKPSPEGVRRQPSVPPLDFTPLARLKQPVGGPVVAVGQSDGAKLFGSVDTSSASSTRSTASGISTTRVVFHETQLSTLRTPNAPKAYGGGLTQRPLGTPVRIFQAPVVPSTEPQRGHRPTRVKPAATETALPQHPAPSPHASQSRFQHHQLPTGAAPSRATGAGHGLEFGARPLQGGALWPLDNPDMLPVNAGRMSPRCQTVAPKVISENRAPVTPLRGRFRGQPGPVTGSGAPVHRPPVPAPARGPSRGGVAL